MAYILFVKQDPTRNDALKLQLGYTPLKNYPFQDHRLWIPCDVQPELR